MNQLLLIANIYIALAVGLKAFNKSATVALVFAIAWLVFAVLIGLIEARIEHEKHTELADMKKRIDEELEVIFKEED